MKNTLLKKSRLSRLIEFIRDYRISISPSKRLSGVGDTLIGWGLIAINVVFFPPPLDLMRSEFSFVLLFLSGCLSLLVYSVFRFLFSGGIEEGIKSLLITKESQACFATSHLNFSQRIRWIYFRGFIAAGGYIAYNISKIYFGVIDNSEIFGADALVYAILAFLLFHETFSPKEIAGIIIASLGVFAVVFFDVENFHWKDGVISATAGLASAISMAIIFFITGIIVRHDSPKRVAFHQCLAGLFLSLFVFILTILLRSANNEFIFPDVSFVLVKNSIISGILYAVAMVFFLRAFLHTEPIVIAVVGYSLGFFVVLIEWLFLDRLLNIKDGTSALLIGFGCFLLIQQQYVKDRKQLKKTKMQKPTYELGLKDELASLKEKYNSGHLDRYSYLSEKHEFNKVLMEYSHQIRDSSIESIMIFPDSLVFVFKEPLRMQFETDGSARSAPFEILNFGSYEAEDESMAYRLIQNGNTVLDVGAHIGWYAINFAKRFPQSKIYSFEPIGITFEFLKRNIERNSTENIAIFNYGCSNKKEEKPLYYFKGGSALASIENLINHKGAQKIKCAFKPIDMICHELQISSVDFIKCDAEGSELFILQGGVNTIKKFKPIIFTELYEEWCQKCGYSSVDVVQMLGSWGYSVFQSIEGKLVDVKQLRFENNERYNYFFLDREKHFSLISKLK